MTNSTPVWQKEGTRKISPNSHGSQWNLNNFFPVVCYLDCRETINTENKKVQILLGFVCLYIQIACLFLSWFVQLGTISLHACKMCP